MVARIHGRTIFKKGLNDPNSYNDVITHLKTDILEHKVKLALESIMMKKASGDRILADLFQILKDDAVKMLHSYASKFGRLSSATGLEKSQSSFPS